MSASASVFVIGLSMKMCLPAEAILSTRSARRSNGLVIVTASTSARSSTASRSSTNGTPNSSAPSRFPCCVSSGVVRAVAGGGSSSVTATICALGFAWNASAKLRFMPFRLNTATLIVSSGIFWLLCSAPGPRGRWGEMCFLGWRFLYLA